MGSDLREEFKQELTTLDQTHTENRQQMKDDLLAIMEDQDNENKEKFKNLIESLTDLEDKQVADKSDLVKKMEIAKQALVVAIQKSEANTQETLKKELADIQSNLDAVNELQSQERVKITEQLLSLIENNKSEDKERFLMIQEKMSDLNNEFVKTRADLELKIDNTTEAMGDQLRTYIDKSTGDLESKLLLSRNKALEELKINIEKGNIEQIEALKQELTEELTAAVTVLEGKISEEKTARQNIVTELQGQLTDATKQMLDQYLSLKESQAETEAKLVSQIGAAKIKIEMALEENRAILEKDISNLETSLNSLREAQKKESDKLLAEINQLEASGEGTAEQIAELTKQLVAVDDQILVTRGELNQKLAEQEAKTEILVNRKVDELENKIELDYATLKADLLTLRNDMEAFRNEVAATYATKCELDKVRLFAMGIKEVTNILGKQIDENDKEIRDLLADEVTELGNRFENEIKQVAATVADLKGKFSTHIDEYSLTMKKMNIQIRDAAKLLREKMQYLRGDFIRENEALKIQLNLELKKAVINFEVTSQSMKDNMNQALANLDAKIDATDLEIQAAKKEAQMKLNEAIAEEQAERELIQQELDRLATELDRVTEIANNAILLAEANADAVGELRRDFEERKIEVAEKFRVQKEDLDQALEAMKDDFSERLENVCNLARQLVANLGVDIQAQFTRVVADVADLEQRLAAGVEDLTNEITEIKNTSFSKETLITKIAPIRSEMIDHLADLINAIDITEIQFITAINPDQKNLPFYDESFKPIMAMCDGNTEASFSNAMGRDNFQFLAQEYVRNLLFGLRGTDKDIIYFGENNYINETGIAQLLLQSTVRYTVGSEAKNCIQEVEQWAKNVLLGDNPDSLTLRKQLTVNQDLEREVKKLRTYALKVIAKAKKIEEIVLDATENQSPAGFLPMIAVKLVEATHASLALIDRRSSYDSIIKVQKNFALTNPDLAVKVDQLEVDLKLEIDQFKESTKQRITQIETKIGKLDAALKLALDGIATLAERSGHNDVRELIIKAGLKIDYDVQVLPTFEPKIHFVQHFFKPPTRRNNSNPCTGHKIDRIETIKTHHQHGLTAACWINFRTIPRGQWVGKARHVFFRFYGSFHQLNIKTVGYNRTFDLRQDTRTPGTILHGSHNEGVCDIPTPGIFDHFLTYNTSIIGKTMITLTPIKITGTTNTPGTPRQYQVVLYSPLILDFHGVGRLSTVSENNGGVMFDMDADGSPESTGWVKSDEGGFLALDINGNGTIDSGAELFGEATAIKNGKSGENGYVALAQHDHNKDGFIDDKDPIFRHLLVWFDRDMDGKSVSSELKTMNDMNVTKLSVNYRQVPIHDQFDNGNRIQYEGKFWGPSQCRENGCNSFDVYFGSSRLLAARE